MGKIFAEQQVLYAETVVVGWERQIYQGKEEEEHLDLFENYIYVDIYRRFVGLRPCAGSNDALQNNHHATCSSQYLEMNYTQAL